MDLFSVLSLILLSVGQSISLASGSSPSFRGALRSLDGSLHERQRPLYAQAAPNDDSAIDHGVLDLQSQHAQSSPSDTLSSLAKFCDVMGIDKYDVYGDFSATANESYLRRFEGEVAKAMGKDDGVFMPSGVMAQQIALLIHAGERGKNSKRFSVHRTSHLLLHEGEGYSKLLGMDAVILPIGTQPCGGLDGGTLGVEPLRYVDAEGAIDESSSLIVELPHRELGGKLTPWEDIPRMAGLCREKNVAIHCDGARIFEAAAGYNMTLPQVTAPFDTVYVSFYKGLGGISGAMLLGSSSFCAEARLWLRRFGGNLYTLLPYATSAWAGYRLKRGRPDGNGDGEGLTFFEKREKLRRVVKALSQDDIVQRMVTFDPAFPETNMVHGFIKASSEECEKALDLLVVSHKIRVLGRVRTIRKEEKESEQGYGCRFEWTMGDSNGAIADSTYIEGWERFISNLRDSPECK